MSASPSRPLITLTSSLALVSIIAACSGPQPLSRAINPVDEQNYAMLMENSDQSPAEAFLAQRADELGVSVEEATRRDRELSSKKNPFNARKDPGAISRGAVIYKNECMSCHGVNADGQGPALPVPLDSLDFHSCLRRIDLAIRGGGAASGWFKTIENGDEAHPKDENGNKITVIMPPFKDRLAKEQIWLLVTYLQSLDTDLSDG